MGYSDATAREVTGMNKHAGEVDEGKAPLADAAVAKKSAGHDAWLAKNKQAIRSYNQYINEHGTFGERITAWHEE